MKSRGSSSIMYWDNDCFNYRKARLVFNVSLKVFFVNLEHLALLAINFFCNH